MSTQDAFHTKYRPGTLEDLIGHKSAVTRLQGIIKSGKVPSAMLFFGPSSVGKTTLARAFAVALNGKLGPDYVEMNAADQRGIDDVRELIRVSKMRPMGGKKRIFVIDEFQGLLSNQAAAQAFLKPLEEPSKDTIWILCSMDPAKFSTGTGRAIANRCTQFALEQHTADDLLEQAKRIVKGESMKYMLAKSEDKKEKYAILQEIVENCNGEMRTLANLMQSAQQYYEGLDDKPKRLKKSDITSVLRSGQSSDDELAVKYVAGIFTRQFKQCHLACLDATDGFGFTRKCLQISRFYLSFEALEGKRHSKVWWNNSNKQFLDILKKAGAKPTLGQIAAVNTAMVEVMAQAGTFATEASDLLSANAFRLITGVMKPAKD